MKQLPIPFPKTLEAAFGLEGDARYFSAHWLPGGDELWLSDGRSGYTADSWSAYLTFIDHATVAPVIEANGLDLGSSDSEAKHALVFDRQERAVHAATTAEAEAFLLQQWPNMAQPDQSPGDSAHSNYADLLEAVRAGTESLPPEKDMMARIQSRRKELSDAEEKMLRDLDVRLRLN